MTAASMQEQWNNGIVTIGSWLFLREPLLAEVAADTGYDYVCIDMQHGIASYSDSVAMIQAMAKSTATPVVRVPWNEPAMIGRVLDAGALGVIIPMVNSAAEAAAAVAACRYAPFGSRSLGPVAAGVRHGQTYVRTANERVACMPMIETIQAVERIDEILSVPGIDAAYVGPADLAMTLGLGPGLDNDHQTFRDAIATIVDACNRHGVIAGIQANPALMERRLAEGFKMITVGYDHMPVVAALKADLAAAKAALSS
jgi:4-hydroxy-2-oxoheptanedioate aldolase